MSQVTYNTEFSPAVAGLVFGDTKDIATRKNTYGTIHFGRVVAKDTADEAVKAFNASGGVVEGVSVRDLSHVEGYYPVNEAVGVLKLGRIWIETETQITPASTVYVCYAGRKQVQTITFDADFVADNKINLKIDGVDLTEVDWDTNHNTTIAALAAKILSDFPDKYSACTASGRVVTATGYANGVDSVISNVTVTGGLSQAAAVVAETVASITDEEAYGKLRADADSPTRAATKTGIKVLRTTAAGEYAPCQINVF